MDPATHAPTLNVTVFGRPNTGKSTLVNALADDTITEVSETPGTTGRPIYLSAALPTIGQATIIDTPGLCPGDRANCKQFGMVNKLLGNTDIALLLLDVNDAGLSDMEQHLVKSVIQRQIPIIFVLTKMDTASEHSPNGHRFDGPSIGVSAVDGSGIADLRAMILERKPETDHHLISDLVAEGAPVLFVTRNDPGDRRNRMQPFYCSLIRESLDAGCMPLLTRESELPVAMTTLTRAPALVVADTDSLDRVTRMIPPDIPLTTVSVLMARHKGNLREFIGAMAALARLRPGDRVLIAEACEHRPLSEQSDYLELPALLSTMTGGPVKIETMSGHGQFPDRLRGYDLVIHCAACSLTRPEMLRRQALARKDGVPLINHAVLQTYIAHALPRALAPLRQNGALNNEGDVLIDPQELRIRA